MSDYSQMYKEKLVSAEEAARAVKSGDWLEYGWCCTAPVAVDKALAKRLPELHDVKFRGGLLMWEPEVFKIENPCDHFCWNSWHMGTPERRAIPKGFCYYSPLRYSELPKYYRESPDPLNVAIFQTTPMDEHGFFNFGTMASHMAAVCEKAQIVIVEVNENMPYCYGGFDEGVHISNVDMIVEGDNPPIFELKPAKPTDVDRKIAEYIVDEIPNGACIQLGIGGMPNTVGSLLCESDIKDLGVQSEMYVEAYVQLSKAGKINGSKKNIDKGRQVYTFAAGSRELYDFLDHNPECMSAPSSYVNDIRTISAQDNFISINNTVEVDLYGQVNAESAGYRQISGAGGQLDFVLGSYLSKGGKSFICCSSSYTTKDGEMKSRIVPVMEPGSIITDTRTNINYLVTEYGKVNLKGTTAWQRAEAIISIAHPMFRDELIKDAENMPILKTIQKIPGGLMVVPLLLGVLVNTFIPQVLGLGGYVTALWGSAAANTIIAVFLFCVGAQIQVRTSGELVKRGGVLLIAKFLSGAVLGWVIGAIFGPAGIMGISTLAIFSAVTNSNGGLYMSLVGTFGDDTDVAAQAVLNVNDGPFLTLVAVGASGLADIPLMSLLCAIAPLLVGMILGNIDKDIADYLHPVLNCLIPFFAFCLGAGISLQNLITGGAQGIILGLVAVAWSGFVCIAADKLITKRPGYAGAAIASAAGNSVATPAAVALAAPSLEPYVETATVQCAAAVIVTAICVPILTSWVAKKWGTAADYEAKKLQQAS